MSHDDLGDLIRVDFEQGKKALNASIVRFLSGASI